MRRGVELSSQGARGTVAAPAAKDEGAEPFAVDRAVGREDFGAEGRDDAAVAPGALFFFLKVVGRRVRRWAREREKR